MQPVKLRDVEALQIEPLAAQPLVRYGDWSCPICGERKLLAGSYSARVRNRRGPPLERWIRVCSDCVTTLPRTLPP